MSTTGLEGVVVAETRLSEVQGEAGRLMYAGYAIEDLARNASFEAVCHLLWTGDLPTESRLHDLHAGFAAALVLPDGVLAVVRMGAARAHPMSTLQAAIATAAFFDPDAADGATGAESRKAVRLTGQSVAITAAIARLRRGLEPVDPDPQSGLAQNLLLMIRGESAPPAHAAALDTVLTLHAEHGMNASTFAARVAAATRTDMHAAVVAGIGTLKGPLHGGANEGVMRMLAEIGRPERARDWVHAALERGERIMGFGHRVYRTTDPRAPILRDMALRLAASERDAGWLAIAEAVRAAMAEEMGRRGRAVYPNVDFFSAPVYSTLGIPPELFPNLFACARMPGWTAHIMEQRLTDRLIRPASTYTGPAPRSVGAVAPSDPVSDGSPRRDSHIPE